MRLYGGQVPIIAEEVLRVLIRSNDVEVADENIPEVELDIQSVLREYIRMDREITNRARDESGRSGESLMRIKKQLAKEKNFQIGEDALGYIINQMIEAFLHSNYVEEVFSEDHDLRKRIRPVLAKHMAVDEELDREVRDKIKNLEEGSQAWDIEYQRVMGNVKRNKGLE
jgi:hypothetical protein